MDYFLLTRKLSGFISFFLTRLSTLNAIFNIKTLTVENTLIIFNECP
jgi:hypothetical protein